MSRPPKKPSAKAEKSAKSKNAITPTCNTGQIAPKALENGHNLRDEAQNRGREFYSVHNTRARERSPLPLVYAVRPARKRGGHDLRRLAMLAVMQALDGVRGLQQRDRTIALIVWARAAGTGGEFAAIPASWLAAETIATEANAAASLARLVKCGVLERSGDDCYRFALGRTDQGAMACSCR